MVNFDLLPIARIQNVQILQVQSRLGVGANQGEDFPLSSAGSEGLAAIVLISHLLLIAGLCRTGEDYHNADAAVFGSTCTMRVQASGTKVGGTHPCQYHLRNCSGRFSLPSPHTTMCANHGHHFVF